MEVGVLECGQTGQRCNRLFKWSKFWSSNWMGSARTAFPFFLGNGDFGIAGILARFEKLVELLPFLHAACSYFFP